jgi:hypothetical protein
VVVRVVVAAKVRSETWVGVVGVASGVVGTGAVAVGPGLGVGVGSDLVGGGVAVGVGVGSGLVGVRADFRLGFAACCLVATWSGSAVWVLTSLLVACTVAGRLTEMRVSAPVTAMGTKAEGGTTCSSAGARSAGRKGGAVA